MTDTSMRQCLEIAELKLKLQAAEVKIAMLVEKFTKAVDMADGLVESMDYLGTGSNSKSAQVEQKHDRNKVQEFRRCISATSESSAKLLAGVKANALEDASARLDSKHANGCFKYTHRDECTSELNSMASELRGVGPD